jgi:hypothetical protein
LNSQNCLIVVKFMFFKSSSSSSLVLRPFFTLALVRRFPHILFFQRMRSSASDNELQKHNVIFQHIPAKLFSLCLSASHPPRPILCTTPNLPSIYVQMSKPTQCATSNNSINILNPIDYPITRVSISFALVKLYTSILP